MGLFRAKVRNRKRRRFIRRKKESSWKDEILSSSSNSDTPVHKLHAKIDALEGFLARRAMEDNQKLQMRKDNILPPPERPLRVKTRRQMSAAERRRYLSERNQSGLRFLALFLIACALGWWLLKMGV